MLLNQIDETLPYILYENVLATCKQQMSTDTHTFFFSCQYVGFKPHFHTVYRWAIKRTSPSITSTACPRNQCCTFSHQHYQLVKQDSPYTAQTCCRFIYLLLQLQDLPLICWAVSCSEAVHVSQASAALKQSVHCSNFHGEQKEKWCTVRCCLCPTLGRQQAVQQQWAGRYRNSPYPSGGFLQPCISAVHCFSLASASPIPCTVWEQYMNVIPIRSITNSWRSSPHHLSKWSKDLFSLGPPPPLPRPPFLWILFDKSIYITERFNGFHGKKTKEQIKAVPLLIPTILEHYIIYHFTCT